MATRATNEPCTAGRKRATVYCRHMLPFAVEKDRETKHSGYGCLHKTDKGAQSQKEIDDREKQRERQTEKQKFQKGKGKYH